MNACTSAHIVVVITSDEPFTNRVSSGLDAALYRCGASRGVFGSPNFQGRSAYTLIGVGGCGEGQGYEAYAGAVNSDPNAWTDTTFTVQNGGLIVSGNSATPKTLGDYSYFGDMNATKNTIYYQAAVPSSPTNGDLWYSTSTASWETFVAGAWQIVSDVTAQNTAARIANQGDLATLHTVDAPQIANGAATEVYSVVVLNDVYKYPTWPVDRVFATIDYTNRLATATNVEVTVTGVRKYQTSASQQTTSLFFCWIAIVNVTDNQLVSSTQDWIPPQIPAQGAGQTTIFNDVTSFTVSVPAGKHFTFTPYARSFTDYATVDTTATLTTKGYTMRIAVIKK